MEHRIKNISENTGIPIKKLYDFLFLLKNGNAIENNELVRATGIPKNALSKAKALLSDIFEKSSQKTQVVKDKLVEVQNLFTSDYFVEESVWNFLENDSYKRIVNILKKYNNLRPAPERSFDQFNSTIETTARRSALMNFNMDVNDKRIALIGDDDLTSIAIALSGRPKRVTVFEIDKRLIKTIKEISLAEKLNVEVVGYDARNRTPKNHEGKYDIVFTDPPYTTEGVALFLSRGIDLLDKSSILSRIYLCYGNSDTSKERVLPVQKLFYDSGLMIRYIFDKFNRYFGAESIGSASSLYILDVSPMASPTIQGEFNEKIYTI